MSSRGTDEIKVMLIDSNINVREMSTIFYILKIFNYYSQRPRNGMGRDESSESTRLV